MIGNTDIHVDFNKKHLFSVNHQNQFWNNLAIGGCHQEKKCSNKDYETAENSNVFLWRRET